MSAEPDTYHGHDGVRRYFEGFDGMLEDVRYEAVEIIPVGDAVRAHARMSGRGAEQRARRGARRLRRSHELDGGKIVRITPYPDQESATGRAGLRPRATSPA